MSEHTKTPYTAERDGEVWTIRASDQQTIAMLDDNGAETEANAAFIVKACNSHAGLVDALKRAETYLQAHRPKGKIKEIFYELNEYENGVMKPIRAALAAAEGK